MVTLGLVFILNNDQLSECFIGSVDGCIDAPRDKSPHIREINDTVAAFQYLQKNYNFIYQFFLKRSIRKYQYQKYLFCIARV